MVRGPFEEEEEMQGTEGESESPRSDVQAIAAICRNVNGNVKFTATKSKTGGKK